MPRRVPGIRREKTLRNTKPKPKPRGKTFQLDRDSDQTKSGGSRFGSLAEPFTVLWDCPSVSTVSENDLVTEVRKARYAIRALTRFILLESTFLLIAAFPLAIGFQLLTVVPELALWLLFIGAVLIIVGAFVSLGAGWSEFEKSGSAEDGPKPLKPADIVDEDEIEEDSPVLLDNYCECTGFERGLATNSYDSS
jgi:hypothetical protein